MPDPEPEQRRVSAAAKKTVDIHVRVTRVEAEQIERAALQHDPPTVAAWLRDLIAERIAEKKR